MRCRIWMVAAGCSCLAWGAAEAANPIEGLLAAHCRACHSGSDAEAGLDFDSLAFNLEDSTTFARWVRVHDRIGAGTMPPRDEPRPEPGELSEALDQLSRALIAADEARKSAAGRTAFRRLNRTEYENTVRDLLDLPGLSLKELLPDDGEASGFDKVSSALDVSHVHVTRYLEAARHALNHAIATSPRPPEVFQSRRYPAQQNEVDNIIRGGDAVLLRDKQAIPGLPVVREGGELPRPVEKAMAGVSEAAVGVFRHEDDAFRGRFRVAPLYRGKYRVRLSLWSFWWDKGRVEPSRVSQALALYAGNRVLGYFDAPSLESKVHSMEVWLNPGEELVFNAASLDHIRISQRPGRAAEYSGPGIAIDWLDFEGPFLDAWPPASHRRLFGDLPFKELDLRTTTIRPPQRVYVDFETHDKQSYPRPENRRKGEQRHFVSTVQSDNPLVDAERLLAAFLPCAFRQPVSDEELHRYVGIVDRVLSDHGSFEEAMATAYQTALCDPQFLYRREAPGSLDQFALASRLSYFLWASMPDDELFALAKAGRLQEPTLLDAQVERMLADPKSERFIEDFLDQWLELDRVRETTPDARLYPEFSRYLEDSMVGETRAYFRELLNQNAGVTHLVSSDFVMINQKLAEHYGIEGVVGADIRRVALPDGAHRGGFITQASILKLTANGTTTSPITRGAWVLDKILGRPPEPPPPGIVGIEPDTRGATTIREQLAAHRESITCASCHRDLDPPGFALESFDVIGKYRERYRSTEAGEEVSFKFPNGKGVTYRLGPPVDSSGVTADGVHFEGIDDYRRQLQGDPVHLARNLASQLVVYATGGEIGFSDRRHVERIVDAVRHDDYGVRSMIDEVVQSPLFRRK